LFVAQVVGFVPTGWTYEMRKAAAAGGPYPFPVRTKAACSVWLIPYSEHSSFPELREYVGYLKPKQVTVQAHVEFSPPISFIFATPFDFLHVQWRLLKRALHAGKCIWCKTRT
jgi:hypothetical protein